MKRLSEPVSAKGEILLRRPELLASSFDLRRCGEKTHSFRIQPVGRGSSVIFLFDHNLFKAVPLFCRLCPDIAFYRPHYAGPLALA
jgi:hypothetical protein